EAGFPPLAEAPPVAVALPPEPVDPPWDAVPPEPLLPELWPPVMFPPAALPPAAIEPPLFLPPLPEPPALPELLAQATSDATTTVSQDGVHVRAMNESCVDSTAILWQALSETNREKGISGGAGRQWFDGSSGRPWSRRGAFIRRTSAELNCHRRLDLRACCAAGSRGRRRAQSNRCRDRSTASPATSLAPSSDPTLRFILAPSPRRRP